MTTPKLIFISHATKDDDPLVNRIADTLDHEGFGTWVDHRRGGLSPSDADWEKSLREAIQKCDVGILVMTENSLTSAICKAECLLVLELKKPLYIIRAEACKPDNIWLTIKMRQYANIVDQFDLGMNHLIRAINGDTDTTLPTPIYIVTGMSSMIDSVSQLDIPLRGRDAEANLVRDWLKTGGLVQIIAVGGLGKSRLCAEIALTHPHGAVWHKCGKVSTANEVFIALREHLNLSVDAKEELVADKMAERRSILVIDNAEDVTHDNRAGYIALFSQLAYRGVPMLLTSREKWHSNQFANRAYTLPDFTDAHLADVMQMTHDFIHKFGKHFTDDEAKQLAKAGRLHPELIEIAVGLIGGGEYDLPTILKRLHELHPKDIQKALDEMITKTLAQMKERTTDGANAYDLIHRLTWVQASFTSDVIAVFKPDSITEDNLPDALATLRRYQFLRYDDTTKRYRIPDLVRDTIGTPKDPALFGIYADFYTTRAEQIFVDLADKPELWADKEGGANFDDVVNIKALGAELMRQTQNGTVGDLARALKFAMMTRRYITDRMEARAWAWLEMGLSAVQMLRKDKVDDETLMAHESLMLGELGEVYQLKNPTLSLAYKEQSLILTRIIGNKLNELVLLNNIGRVYKSLNEMSLALRYYKSALAICHEMNDRATEGKILNNIGGVYLALGKKEQALYNYETALLLYRQLNDIGSEGTTLTNIGMVYSSLGKKQKALEFYTQALHIHRVVGDKQMEATDLNNIGTVYDALSDRNTALEYYQQALSLRLVVEDRYGEATTLNNIGGIYKDLDENQKALNHFERSLIIYHELGDKGGEATSLHNIATVYYNLNNLDKAIQYHQNAISTTFPQDPDLPQWQNELIMLKRKRGDPDVLPEEDDEPEFDALITRLADIYKQVGEAGLRDMLKQSNVPEAQIDEIITVVVAHIAGDGGDGGDDEDESADMLPFETVREWVQNTYTVLKHDTHELENWREQLEGAKMRMVGMGDDWANEVGFVEALLAVLRGEFPVLPTVHPYHEPVRQLVEAVK